MPIHILINRATELPDYEAPENEEESIEAEFKTSKPNEEEIEATVARKVRETLNSLDLTPKTLSAKRKKLNRQIQQNKIIRLSQASRNRFTFANASNNIDSSDESTASKNKIEIYLLFKILFVKI